MLFLPVSNQLDWNRIREKAHLGDIHAGIAAQGLSGHETIRTNYGCYHAFLVDLLNHGSIDEVDEASPVHGDTWWGKGGGQPT